MFINKFQDCMFVSLQKNKKPLSENINFVLLAEIYLTIHYCHRRAAFVLDRRKLSTDIGEALCTQSQTDNKRDTRMTSKTMMTL